LEEGDEDEDEGEGEEKKPTFGRTKTTYLSSIVDNPNIVLVLRMTTMDVSSSMPTAQ
jgi:hypothetical protein